MKRTILAFVASLYIVLLLGGCASIDNAGFDSYVVKSFAAPLGMVACCELAVKSGKEYEGRQVKFETNGSGATLIIVEGQAKAFKGQALAVKALNIMPTVGLSDILSGDK